MNSYEMFNKLGYTKRGNSFVKNDGGYITEISFNHVTQAITISSKEGYNNNENSESLITLDAIDAIMAYCEENGWKRFI